MGKVKLPKNVADAIETVKIRSGERGLYNHPSIALHASNNKEYKIIHDFINQNDENLKKYYRALLDGYELEPTQEEVLCKQYEYYLRNGKHVSANAYIEVLSILGLKIKGITV